MSSTNIAVIAENLIGSRNKKWGLIELTMESEGHIKMLDAELTDPKTIIKLEIEDDAKFLLTVADNSVNVDLQVHNTGSEKIKVKVDPTYPNQKKGPHTTVLSVELNPGAGSSLEFSDGSGVHLGILPNRPVS